MLHRLSGKSENEQMGFMETWMTNHWQDARTILKKPLVIAEFGKSSKDPGFSLNDRELYMGTVYRDIYRYARTSGGTMSGSLVWQLMAQGMDAYDDGYDIVLSQTPSIARIMSSQSHAMSALSHLATGMGDGTMGIPHGHGHGHHRHARRGRKHRRIIN